MTFVKDIDTVEKAVRINSSIPYSVVKPFLETAHQVWITRFYGIDLVSELENENLTEVQKRLLGLSQTAETLLALWLGNAELSVRISDSGFTVSRTDNYAPASDTKISEVKKSLCVRAFQHLDIALSFLQKNVDTFKSWTLSKYYLETSEFLISTPAEFQSLGVDINYSLLRFEMMRPLMSQVEIRFIRNYLPKNFIFDDINLLEYAKRFIANKTAEIYTSQNTISVPRDDDNIRPLYFDLNFTGNFYAEQASYFYSKFEQAYIEYQKEQGVQIETGALNFNNDENSIFVAEG